MSDRRFRDHNQPCEHEEWRERIITRTDRFDPDTEYTFWSCGKCPGGREVRIDIEAGVDAMVGRPRSPWDELHPSYRSALAANEPKVRRIVEAAIVEVTGRARHE